MNAQFSSGGTNHGFAYAATQFPGSGFNGCLSSATKGACTIVRIRNGSMPAFAGCSGNPATDSANAACLTQTEQNAVDAWIMGGQAP
jgi:hypothetical protein